MAIFLGRLLFAASVICSAAGVDGGEPCRVLALSGGGSYGAFEAGVLKRLATDDPMMDYDFISGVSAGAMNAGFLSLFGYGNWTTAVEELEQNWLSIQSNGDVYKTDVLFNVFKSKSLFDTAPMRKTLAGLIKGRSVLRPVTIGITNIGTGLQEQINEKQVTGVPAEELVSLVMASAAIPVLFPAIEFKGSHYYDGGLAANQIVVQAIERCPAGSNVSVDIMLCDPALPVVNAASLSFTQLIFRTGAIAEQTFFDNFRRFECDPGRSSNIHARMYYPASDDKMNSISALDFTQAPALLEAGAERSVKREFNLCL